MIASQTDIQQVVLLLQRTLGLNIVTGQITLNLNEATLQSVETKTYQRITGQKAVDRRATPRL